MNAYVVAGVWFGCGGQTDLAVQIDFRDEAAAAVGRNAACAVSPRAEERRGGGATMRHPQKQAWRLVDEGINGQQLGDRKADK